jgi:hypothetical protein
LTHAGGAGPGYTDGQDSNIPASIAAPLSSRLAAPILKLHRYAASLSFVGEKLVSRQYQPKTRSCENCGATFAPGRSRRTLCPACQTRANRATVFAYESQLTAARLLTQVRNLLEADDGTEEGAAKVAAQAHTLRDLVAQLWSLLPLSDHARRAALVVISESEAAAGDSYWTDAEIDRIAAELLAGLELSFGD